MHRKTKLLIKIWCRRFIYLCILGLLVWANYLSLRNDVFSNYEKAVDYGRMNDEDKLVEPVIAAIFYAGKNEDKGQISSYFNHSDNYKRRDVKMVVVPKKLEEHSVAVVEKLYEEIGANNEINRVLLVYMQGDDVVSHQKMLREVMQAKKIRVLKVSEESLAGEEIVKEYLNKKKDLIVMLADLAKGIGQEDSDFLTDEAIYFAQKKHYKMNVFDVIDTQIAKAVEKDYEAMYPIDVLQKEPLLLKQKRNLERYLRHHGHDLISYFELNLLRFAQKQKEELPLQNDENYRLYDRGRIVMKAYDENFLQVFEVAKLQQNDGIIVSVINAVRDLEVSGKADKAQFFKIYLLTDMEEIKKDKDTMLMSYLDQDDGVYAEYKEKSALLVADDRPDNPEDLTGVLRQKAAITLNTAEEDIHFYKFKTVEIEYGD